MRSLFFWTTWPAEYRRLWYGVAVLFFLSLIFLWFSYFRGVDGIIHWDTIQEQKVVEATVHSFRLGPFTFDVPGESYILFEYFNGSPVQPNTTASYFFLTVLTLSAVVLLTVLTTLERFWFYAAIGLFILFMVSFRFEVLGLFGQYNRIPSIAILLAYVIPAVYFGQFNKTSPFVIRLAIFLGLTLVVGLMISFFSNVDTPFYHLTVTGYAPGLILSMLFMIMVAHEILAAFVHLVSKGSTKSLQHLSIICAIYMINLFLAALHEMDVIRWNFIYVNLYLLLTASGIVGIWGFREREALYGNVISFKPFGSLLFLAMGAICFATIGQLLGNGNDPGLKVLGDVIIFSHTGYGLIFITYLVSNFILMLARNIDASKVLYKPNRMPYVTYRLAGFIAMLAFILVSDIDRQVFQGMAGFYNSVGDMYALQGNDVYAESFYEQASSRGFADHHSNYAVGLTKTARLDFEGARGNYGSANYKNPSVYSLANAGNVFLWENNIFGAIDDFRKSYKRMPNSGALAGNLGLAFAKVHNLDSALYYFDQARAHRQSKDLAEANFFAMVTQEHIPVKPDSVLKVFGTQSPATVGNALALAILTGDSLDVPLDPVKDRKLDLFTATLLNNYCLKKATELDTTFSGKALAIISDSINDQYSIALKSSLAFVFYHQGNVAKALQLMAEQVYVSQAYQGKFNYVQGLWALEQGNPELASSYFTYADTYEYKRAKFYNALALSEARNIQEALQAWDEVLKSEEEGERNIAVHMKEMLSISASDALLLPDAEKYQFCRYRIGPRDSVVFNRIVNTFQNANYKAQSLLDMSRKCYAVDDITSAIRIFNRTAGLQLSDKRLYDEIRHFELRMLASRKEVRSLASQINKGIVFDASRSLDKMLYTALIMESSGDSTKTKQYYQVLGTYNPYFEEGIIAAADFFRSHEPKSMKAYTILSEAIQVNANSIKLLKAYFAEANRKGFDDYAASVAQRLQARLQDIH